MVAGYCDRILRLEQWYNFMRKGWYHAEKKPDQPYLLGVCVSNPVLWIQIYRCFFEKWVFSQKTAKLYFHRHDSRAIDVSDLGCNAGTAAFDQYELQCLQTADGK